jgi:hypothetical protein
MARDIPARKRLNIGAFAAKHGLSIPLALQQHKIGVKFAEGFADTSSSGKSLECWRLPQSTFA